MEAYSSGEELFIKTRKPYTITKQRERWTNEDHSRFLEAVKLYGRAWRRIEEHIGTKSAVQIRSHAQKFFSKLEKDAIAKGIPVGQNIDIDIPPPRPKKKPSNPYPRKTNTLQLKDRKQVTSGSLHPSKQVLDLETEPLPENSVRDGGQDNKEDKYDGTNRSYKCSEAVTVDKPKNDAKENKMQVQDANNLAGNVGSCSHAPSSDVSYQESAHNQIGVQAHPAIFTTAAVPPISETPINPSGSVNHYKLPRFDPDFQPFNGNQEHYAALLQMSSTFSRFVFSTYHGEHIIEGFPPKTINLAPSMAAIAGATVAAATAWWATHGLLPPCAPEPERKEKEINNNIQNSGSKSRTTSPSDSGDGSGPKVNNVLTADDKKNRKQLDPSSCGSNSSSDLETAALGKHEETKISVSSNDSRKEVSEEGRMAFKALFLREVLPQSFLSPHKHTKKIEDEENIPNVEESDGDTVNRLAKDINVKQGLNTTGFKPYKRCWQDQEKDPKRVRLGEEALS